MRAKHRYILLMSTHAVEGQSIKRALFYKLGINYYKASIRIISMQQNIAIIKCSLESFMQVIAALTMVKEVDGHEIAFYTLKASGTLRALKAKATQNDL